LLKIRIVGLGKDKDDWVRLGSQHYVKLLSKYTKTELKLLPSLKLPPSLSSNEIKRKEEAVLAKELSGGYCIALSDKGEQYDSPALARFMEKLQITSSGSVVFLIGGPYGLDESLLNRADAVLSLSPLTFPHQLVRLILLEQLYRAFSILHNTNYHK